jgi:hypothetical protein
MTLSFSLTHQKMQSLDAGHAKKHNCRLTATPSQLRHEAWFTPEGRQEIMPWRPEILARAKGLMKRKDAVVAVSFVVQVGNQMDWRDLPSEDFPEGKPRPWDEIKDSVEALAKAAKEWAIKEFGEDNIVGIDLHLDESSPHVHVVVTPVKVCPVKSKGVEISPTPVPQLLAKEWMDGASRCAALRKRAWQVVNSYIPCTYVPGKAGGAPHDPDLAAGKAGKLAKQKAALDAREAAIEAEIRAKVDAAVAQREAALDEREVAVYGRESTVAAKERIIEDRQDAMKIKVGEITAQLVAREQAVAAREDDTPAVIKAKYAQYRQIFAAMPEAAVTALPQAHRDIVRAVRETLSHGQGYNR